MKTLASDIDFKKIALSSLYGLGMVWSPIFGTSEAVVFPTLAAFPEALLISRIVNLAALAVVMAVLAVAGERIRDVIHCARFVVAVAIVGAVGVLVGCLVGLGVLPLGFLYVGAAARGIFWGFATVLWIDSFVHLEESFVGTAVSASLALYALAGFAALGAFMVHPVLSAVFLTACPILCCAGYISERKVSEVPRRIIQGESPAPRRTRVLLNTANFLFGIMLGALLYYFACYDTPVSIAAFFIASVIMLVVFALPDNAIGLHKALRAFMMCLAIIVPCVILMGFMNQGVATAIASGVLAIIILYTIVIFTDTQARLSKPYWRMPGMTQVFAAVGMIIASIVSYAVFPQGDMPDSYLVLLSAACMLFVASLFLPSAQTVARPWGFSSLMPEESRELKLMRRCGELADEHGLTSRELEILQHLAFGATRDETAAALFISPATVKTHIRNIYSKLGVHSQGELQTLIEA